MSDYKREELEPIDLLDVLLDPDNRQPIVLMDENGKMMQFEQVAIVPLEGVLYCVLKPLDHIEGVADDEAIVFRIDCEDNQPSSVKIELREDVARKVFEIYLKMLEDAQKKS